MVVFTTGVRLNVTVEFGLFYVYFDRQRQQPQHSWTIVNVLAHFNGFPLFTQAYIKIQNCSLSSSDLEGQKTLTSPELARVNLLKVSVSENLLSQFLGQEKKREIKID